jgi:hypothetical protein
MMAPILLLRQMTGRLHFPPSRLAPSTSAQKTEASQGVGIKKSLTLDPLDRLENTIGGYPTSGAPGACMALMAARPIAPVEIKSVGFAIVRSGSPRKWNGPVDRRQHPHISDDRTQILFFKVGKLIPGHPLPMELPAVPANAAANRTRQLRVSPGANSVLRIRRDVARPQCAKRLPANWRAAASIRSMAQFTAYRVEIAAAFHHADAPRRHATRAGRNLPGIEGFHEWIRRHAGEARPL